MAQSWPLFGLDVEKTFIMCLSIHERWIKRFLSRILYEQFWLKMSNDLKNLKNNGFLYCTNSTPRKSEWRFGALGKYVGLFMGQINTLKKKVKCDPLFGCFFFLYFVVYGIWTQVILSCMILYDIQLCITLL